MIRRTRPKRPSTTEAIIQTTKKPARPGFGLPVVPAIRRRPTMFIRMATPMKIRPLCTRVIPGSSRQVSAALSDRSPRVRRIYPPGPWPLPRLALRFSWPGGSLPAVAMNLRQRPRTGIRSLEALHRRFVILRRIEIQEDGVGGDGDMVDGFGAASPELTEAASGVQRQDLVAHAGVDQDGVAAALAVEGDVDILPTLPFARGAKQGLDDRGGDAGLVAEGEEEPAGARIGGGDAALDGGEHAGRVGGVLDDAGAGAGEGGRDLSRPVADHHQHLV